MKKKEKKIISFLLAVVCIASSASIQASATDLNTDISWFGSQNGNPWNGSKWTFCHGRDGDFTKMPYYVTESKCWSSNEDGSKTKIDTWRHYATPEDWAVTAFSINEDGNISGDSRQPVKLEGTTNNAADLMVVLKSKENERFYPVYPVAGAWEWRTVSPGEVAEFSFETGYKAGDVLYYIVKAPDNEEITRLQICPQVVFRGGTPATYPETFTEFPSDQERPQDVALIPAEIHRNLSEEKYQDANRQYQGCPAIEVTEGGRLWAGFMTGGVDEGAENYNMLVYSDDKGQTWSSPQFAIEAGEEVRVSEPVLWRASDGRLWVLWAQAYHWYDGRQGVFLSICDNPDAEPGQMSWSKPVRIANGYINTKPTERSDGSVVLNLPLWEAFDSDYNYLPEERYSNVYVTRDNGESFQFLGKADVPNRTFDEPMIIEKKDGSLWMLVRTDYGIGESFSYDGGKTWTKGVPSEIAGPSSRFYIGRLQSGNLLLVNHYNFNGRSHMTAMISEDDGTTWKGFLLLDERINVSYPDVTQDQDGRIYVVYDHERYADKEILMASFTEEEVRNGSLSDTAVVKKLINQAMGETPLKEEISFLHSWQFNASDKTQPVSIKTNGVHGYSYEYGTNGIFEGLNTYDTNLAAWTDDGANPMIASWYMGAAWDKDCALIWHTPGSGKAVITTGFALEQKEKGGKIAQFMVAQRRNGQYYPLYPEKGSFVWQEIGPDDVVSMPEITTRIEKNDEVVFVLRGDNVQLKFNPNVVLYQSLGTSEPVVGFQDWPKETEQKDPVVKEYTKAEYEEFKSADETPKLEGYVFTGWFTSAEVDTEENMKAHVLRNVAGLTDSDLVYARFVGESMLDVKAQLNADADSSSEEAHMRLLTTADNLAYRKIGFKITINGKTRDTANNIVYRQLDDTIINGVKETITPDCFHKNSQYFKAYTIKNIPQNSFDTSIEVTPYLVTLDGTTVYGRTVSKTVNQGIAARESNVQ